MLILYIYPVAYTYMWGQNGFLIVLIVRSPLHYTNNIHVYTPYLSSKVV